MDCTEAGDEEPFRVLPDTCVELFIRYTDTLVATVSGNTVQGNKRSFISFRMSAFVDVQMQPGSGCIAVCLYPGAAYNFFSIPMSEYSNGAIELRNVWKNSAAEMEEKVALAKSNNQRVEIIQNYLLAQLAKNYKNEAEMQHCLWQINLLKAQSSVQSLVQKTNISHRTLNRKFHSHIGLSPKEYVRISRFLYSLSSIKQNPETNFTEIAHENGYYDQAHFIHDFREYTGITPKELFSGKRIVFCWPIFTILSFGCAATLLHQI